MAFLERHTIRLVEQIFHETQSRRRFFCEPLDIGSDARREIGIRKRAIEQADLMRLVGMNTLAGGEHLGYPEVKIGFVPAIASAVYISR
jgi:hypothetical protein